jgi:large subunit ribosomal protein L23Ae
MVYCLARDPAMTLGRSGVAAEMALRRLAVCPVARHHESRRLGQQHTTTHHTPAPLSIMAPAKPATTAAPKKAAAAAAKTLSQRKKQCVRPSAAPASPPPAQPPAPPRLTSSGRETKLRTKVHFFRPKTLEKARAPKYPRKSMPSESRLASKFAVIKKPLTSESVMKKIENFNTLVFLVDLRANKRQIKSAVSALYDCNVVGVNTLVRPDGQKKAYVKLSKEDDALEIANKVRLPRAAVH